MQIIQSFWSKPCFHEKQEYANSRVTGGWMDFKYFLFSCCFSCLTLKRYYDEVNLYTDNEGYSLFIDELNLPYDHVSLILNQLNNENSKLWVLGKLLTIKIQEKPFIHVDNDIYLWEKLPENTSDCFLIAQNNYKIPYMHTNSLNEILIKFKYIPSYISKAPTTKTKNTNIGILGGNNIPFFQEYCNIAYELLKKNKTCLNKIEIGPFNQILDEYLFTSMVRDKNLNITYVIENSPFDDLESVNAVVRFNLVPMMNKYIHLLGNLKKNVYACEQLVLRFEYEFPDHYNKVLKFIEAKTHKGFNESATNDERIKRLKKAIPLLYNKSVCEFKKMKLRLIDSAIIQKSSIEESGQEFTLLVKDPISGKIRINKLMGTDAILAYFQQPVSINELIEEFKFENPSMNRQQSEKHDFKILDIVSEKMMIDGLLELA